MKIHVNEAEAETKAKISSNIRKIITICLFYVYVIESNSVSAVKINQFG